LLTFFLIFKAPRKKGTKSENLFNKCVLIRVPAPFYTVSWLVTCAVFSVIVVPLIVSSATGTLVVEVPGVLVVRSRLAHTTAEE